MGHDSSFDNETEIALMHEHNPGDSSVQDLTLAAYESGAAEYAAATSEGRSSLISELLDLVPRGSHVLELGTGTGRDASEMEAEGLRVDRTDAAQSFVDRLITGGHSARMLDVRDADFGGPYDAVFANAVLLHVPRADLSSVFSVARQATRAGGILAASFKRGAGEGWSTRKLPQPRHFTYWEEESLGEVLQTAGWSPIDVYDSTQPASAERWITVTARNTDVGDSVS